MPTIHSLRSAARAPLCPLPWTLAVATLLAGCQHLTAPSADRPALSAQPRKIEAGQSVRLSWDAPLGSSLRLEGLTSTPPGSVLVRPAQTTTYTLSGPAPSGGPISASVTVEVQPAATPLARLRLGDNATGERIAPGFLGFSHDWGQAQLLMGDPAVGPVNGSYRQLLRNLQNYGGGPLSIRIGGDTPGASTPDMRPLAQLARDLPTRFILGVNPDRDGPALAAQQARSFAQEMPADTLAAIEWTGAPLPANARVAGTPASSAGLPEDVQQKLTAQGAPAGILTQPGYAGMSQRCGGHPKPGFLLEDAAVRAGVDAARPALAVARAAGKPYRLAPMNSILCTGEPGVSDAFESALWMADTLMEYAHLGVAGVNLHTNLWDATGWETSSAFRFDLPEAQLRAARVSAAPADLRLAAQYQLNRVYPLYYGMLFFAQFAGQQGQWLPTQLETDAQIKAWAVRDPQSQAVRVAVINKEPTTHGTVALQLPAGFRQAVVTRLTAPSSRSADQVRLAGQTFDGSRDGRPVGTAYGEVLEADSEGQLLLAMGAASAALLTLTAPH